MSGKDSPTDLSPPAPPGVPWLHVAIAALLLTALNAIKPVHIDDYSYVAYGAEFAAHPLDPYAFHYGSPYYLPANGLLMPPVLLYWLGLGTALFGSHLIVLKLWLFPFAAALGWGIAFLATRLAPSLRVPLLWLGLFSSTVLPGFNFMLDVPVLALGVSALAVAVRGTERNSLLLALLAGLLAGLAVQTKYTGVVSCAAVLAWYVLNRHPARGGVAILAALAVAVGWEWALAQVQGESHFLGQLKQRQGKALQRALHLALPLLSQVAGLVPAAALLGLTALGWSGRRTLLAGVGVLGVFALLALVPSQAAIIEGANGKPILTMSNIIYGLLALLAWVVLARASTALVRREKPAVIDWFLLAWLALELGGYFALSPFPAARRVIGLVLVFTLIAGRLAHLRGVSPRIASWSAAFGVALALLFFGTDLLEARASREAARQVAHGSHRPAEGGTFWHLGWWGLPYYADQEGLKPLRLNQQLPRPGDLLALHDLPELRAVLAQHPEIGLELLDTVVVGDDFPLQLMPGYYHGRTPLEHHRGARIRVLIYRVTAPATRPPQ